jgi:hypothetical protein
MRTLLAALPSSMPLPHGGQEREGGTGAKHRRRDRGRAALSQLRHIRPPQAQVSPQQPREAAPVTTGKDAYIIHVIYAI